LSPDMQLFTTFSLARNTYSRCSAGWKSGQNYFLTRMLIV